ncbi:TetR/AcrR family transcriptional regulator [Sulfitobacter sp. S190]|uniref:TetR/AcrR family transcriptional regulator n=1 Tax=Sulfitobacter sp. S190 TaxID=2867022 RepID=UPI0021A4FC0A|nr:TetR-like C-terminal domain-containing protein [Sulfitobacter sp. S190]UWR23180.1 WHG domain-containing protein [Sulfitobacter sp. S190]
MSARTDARHADLRARLAEAAERRIAQAGLGAMKARALAAEVGCALGAIYTVYDDLDALVLAVNARTFRRLGAHVTQALDTGAPRCATEQMVTLARGYYSFARDNPRLWQALFDVALTDESAVPQWYLAELGALFALIDAPLARARPELPAQDRALLTRALYASVHGIVLLGVQRRISAVPEPQIDRMLEMVVRGVAAG